MAMNSLLFLVPARGGSKGVPKKNIAEIAGKPLLAWSINAALKCRHSGRVIVTTESEEIAQIARAWKAEVPFMRPEELSGDEIPSLWPALHALQWLSDNEAFKPDYLVLLQATSPLREARDIDAAIDLAMAKNADAVVSVSPVSCHPYWTKKLDVDGRMADFISLDKPTSRRQNLPNAFGLNGAIYLIKPEVLAAQKTWYPPSTFAYVMPTERALDVDTPWDVRLADMVLRDRLRDGEQRIPNTP